MERPDQAACALSGLELHPVAPQAPSRVRGLHKGLFSLINSPCIVGALTTLCPPEALLRAAPGWVSLI